MNAEHPLARPADETLQELAQASGSKQLGDLTASTLLGERAALLGLPRPFGGKSCSGASRLLSCDDGCIAVSLPRESDWELLPAWLEADQVDCWLGVQESLRTRSMDRMLDRGRLLGLAVSDASAPPGVTSLGPLKAVNNHAQARARRPVVVDLSVLWAGPLCAQLLGLAGAHVIKVESTTRPDGARLGNQHFYGLLNQGKRSVALNFDDPNQARVLHRLLEGADIVIESSRPRALKQLGVCPDELVNRREGLAWVSITGYGREEPEANWIAFGDDAGAAAGLSYLMKMATGNYEFAGDAIADPLTGIEAAWRAWNAWRGGRSKLISLAMKDVVGWYLSRLGEGSQFIEKFAGWWCAKPATVPTRPITGRVEPLGACTMDVIQEFNLC